MFSLFSRTIHPRPHRLAFRPAILDLESRSLLSLGLPPLPTATDIPMAPRQHTVVPVRPSARGFLIFRNQVTQPSFVEQNPDRGYNFTETLTTSMVVASTHVYGPLTGSYVVDTSIGGLNSTGRNDKREGTETLILSGNSGNHWTTFSIVGRITATSSESSADAQITRNTTLDTVEGTVVSVKGPYYIRIYLRDTGIEATDSQNGSNVFTERLTADRQITVNAPQGYQFGCNLQTTVIIATNGVQEVSTTRGNLYGLVGTGVFQEEHTSYHQEDDGNDANGNNLAEKWDWALSRLWASHPTASGNAGYTVRVSTTNNGSGSKTTILQQDLKPRQWLAIPVVVAPSVTGDPSIFDTQIRAAIDRLP